MSVSLCTTTKPGCLAWTSEDRICFAFISSSPKNTHLPQESSFWRSLCLNVFLSRNYSFHLSGHEREKVESQSAVHICWASAGKTHRQLNNTFSSLQLLLLGPRMFVRRAPHVIHGAQKQTSRGTGYSRFWEYKLKIPKSLPFKSNRLKWLQCLLQNQMMTSKNRYR